MTEQWRCFVAAPLGDDLRAALATAVDAWRREPPADQLRWADPDRWHLTLAFLASVPADSIASVPRILRGTAATHRPMRVETGRLGAFHRAGSVRTLWYGVADPDGSLAALATDLGRALGVPVGDAYRPHVTLARARQRPVDLRGWIEPASLRAPGGRIDLRTIELMRSHISNGPARYETLGSFDLGGAA